MRESYLKELYVAFTSRRVTVYSIAVLSGLFFLGLVIPQQAMLSPQQFAAWQAKWPGLVAVLTAFKLTSIYSSPLVVVVEVFFFLNLLFVTARRVPAVLKSMRLPETVLVTDKIVQSMPIQEQIIMEDRADAARIRSRFSALGFLIVEGNSCFVALKNRYAPLGSLFFHVSFLFFLAGGLFLFHTRFRGETFVTEGQQFSGTREEYRSVARLSEMRTSLPELRFSVDKIRPRFEKLEPVSLETHITAENGGIRRSGQLDVNHPLRLGTTSILVTDVGIAPFVQVVDRRGDELMGAFVALNIIRGDTDHVMLPGTDYAIHIRFWPDAAVNEAGNRYTRSYDLNHPLYDITIKKGGKIVVSGTIAAPSESIGFDGMRLFVRDMRYYGGFLVIDEQGGGLLITGFMLALIGLMIRFLQPKKEVLAAWRDVDGKSILYIGYQREYLRGLGRQEFDEILSKVK